MRRPVVFFEAIPRRHGVGLVSVKTCSAAELVNGPDGAVWQPAIARAPTITYELITSSVTGGFSVSYGDISLRVSPSFGNADWATYEWDGAPCKLWLRLPSGSFVQLLEGRCGPLAKPGPLEATVSLRGPEGDFDRPMLTASYAGTGGVEGEASLKGAPKPWCSGICEGVAGVLVSRTHWVWQVHGYGAIDGITAAYEQGLSLGASAGNYSSYSALIAASLKEGQWATCLAEGLVRFGAQPTGAVTFDVRGARDGAAFPTRAAAIAAHILRVRGVPSGKISATSQSDFDAAFPHDYGIFIDNQTRVGDVVRKIVSDCLGYLFADGSGVWRFGRVPSSKTATLLTDSRSTEPLVQSIIQQAAMPPVGRARIGGRRCWRVHSEAEISPVLFERGEYSPTEVYRAGNIVTNQGARWTYININPGSGNAPPTLPTTSNAYWLMIVGQTDWATITGSGKPADNATRNVFRGSWTALAVGTAFVLGDEVLDQNALWTPVVAHTKTAGNGPPTLPATSNATWQLKLESGAGAPGLNVATAAIYAVAASAPAAPSVDVDFTFSTGAFTGLPSPWQADIPAPVSGQKRWRRQAPAASVSATVTILSANWGAAVEFPKDGADGADALTFSAQPDVVTILCDSAGVPRPGELPRTITTTVYEGATNVTASVSFGFTASGVVASATGGGNFSVSAILQDSATLDITATRGGKAAVKRISVQKVPSGANAATVIDDSLTINNSSSYLTTAQGGPMTLGVASGTITLSVAHGYVGDSSASQLAGKVQYRTTPGSGPWVDVGAEATAIGSAGPGEPDSLFFTRTISGPTTPANWEFRYLNRIASGGTSSASGGQVFQVSFAP